MVLTSQCRTHSPTSMPCLLSCMTLEQTPPQDTSRLLILRLNYWDQSHRQATRTSHNKIKMKLRSNNRCRSFCRSGTLGILPASRDQSHEYQAQRLQPSKPRILRFCQLLGDTIHPFGRRGRGGLRKWFRTMSP